MFEPRYVDGESRLLSQSAPLRDRSSWLVEVMLAAAVFLFGGILIGGRSGFALTSCGALAAAYLVGMIGRKLLPNSIVLIAVLCVYGAQIAIQVAVGAFDVPELEVNAQFGLYEHNTAITLSQLCLLVGTLLAAGVLSMISSRTRGLADSLWRVPTPKTKVYLVAALLLTVSGSVVPYALSGSAQYLSFVLTNNIDGVCFFVGWFASDLGLAGIFCLAALLGNAVVAGVLGTRYGLVLLGIYVVGRLLSPRERNRRNIAAVCALFAIPAMLLFSAIGELRQVVGRGSLDLLNASDISALFQITSESAHEDEAKEPLLQSLSRLYAWPNAAAVALTPDPVPYRGFQQWFAEMASFATIFGNSVEGKALSLRNGTGVYHAADYGFSSSITSTVEFGVVADGWSTAGPLGVVFCAFLTAFALCGAERALVAVPLSSGGTLVMLCVLCKMSIMCYASTVPIILRSVLLNSIMWLLIVLIADRVGARQSWRSVGLKQDL